MSDKMTAKQYQAMIKLETGETISLEVAKRLMAIEDEHEAEAIAGGKYDFDLDLPPRHRLSDSELEAQADEDFYNSLTPEELAEASALPVAFELAEQKKELEREEKWGWARGLVDPI